MKLFKLLSLGSILAIAGFGQTTSFYGYDKPDYVAVSKLLKIPSHIYVVNFTYNRNQPLILATYTNLFDLSHCETSYSASATVSEIISGEERRIGDVVETYFQEGMCYNGNYLVDLVENQLKSIKSFTPTLEAAFQKLRDDAAYAAQKPFEQNGHVLNVTRRGVKEEINEVQIDGVVVWKNPKPISEPEHGFFTWGTGTNITTIGSNTVIVK